MRRFNFNLKHMLVCMAALLSPQFQLAGVYPLVPALYDGICMWCEPQLVISVQYLWSADPGTGVCDGQICTGYIY